MPALGVSYESIAQLEENCTMTAARITNLVEQLNTDLVRLSASWTGLAENAYHRDTAKWTQANSDLALALRQIGVRLGEINHNYQNTERTNTANAGG